MRIVCKVKGLGIGSVKYFLSVFSLSGIMTGRLLKGITPACV